MDPKLFIPDPWLCFLLNLFRGVEIRKFTVSPVFQKKNDYLVCFLKKKIVKFHLKFYVNEKKIIKEIKYILYWVCEDICHSIFISEPAGSGSKMSIPDPDRQKVPDPYSDPDPQHCK